MAYKQKSKDISGLMMKMKSPLNYGGESAMMKKSAMMKMGDEKKKTTVTTDPQGLKTITTEYSGEGKSAGGGKSYEEAYKSADKTKYPTLESFTEAAKKYKSSTSDSYERVESMTQVPIKGAISIKTEPKIRDVETLTPEKTPYDPGDGTKRKITNVKTKKKKRKKNRRKRGGGLYDTKFDTTCVFKNGKVKCK